MSLWMPRSSSTCSLKPHHDALRYFIILMGCSKLWFSCKGHQYWSLRKPVHLAQTRAGYITRVFIWHFYMTPSQLTPLWIILYNCSVLFFVCRKTRNALRYMCATGRSTHFGPPNALVMLRRLFPNLISDWGYEVDPFGAARHFKTKFSFCEEDSRQGIWGSKCWGTTSQESDHGLCRAYLIPRSPRLRERCLNG